MCLSAVVATDWLPGVRLLVCSPRVHSQELRALFGVYAVSLGASYIRAATAIKAAVAGVQGSAAGAAGGAAAAAGGAAAQIGKKL